MFKRKNTPIEPEAILLAGKTPAELLQQYSEFSVRKFSIVPYADREITLVEGPYKGKELWIVDYILIPMKNVKFYSDGDKSRLGIHPTDYMTLYEFAQHIAGKGGKCHPNAKTKRIVVEGNSELFVLNNGEEDLPLIEVSQVPLSKSFEEEIKESSEIIHNCLASMMGVLTSFLREPPRGWREYVGRRSHLRDIEELYDLPTSVRVRLGSGRYEVEVKDERVDQLRNILELFSKGGYSFHLHYKLYPPLLGSMEESKIAIVAVKHPSFMTLEDTLHKSILEPTRQEIKLIERAVRLDPEFEVVFPKKHQ